MLVNQVAFSRRSDNPGRTRIKRCDGVFYGETGATARKMVGVLDAHLGLSSSDRLVESVSEFG